MFCSTVNSGMRLNAWNTKPMFRRRKMVSSRFFMAKISRPSRNTLPEVGRSSPPSRLSRVLLPEPLSPTTATNSPFGTEKFTFFSACTAVSPEP